jgi:hypothetical protein
VARPQTFLSAHWTEQWQESYAGLPTERQVSCDRAILALIKRTDSPGLNVKPVLPDKYFWEARISSGDRIIFRRGEGMIVFIDVVAHDEIQRFGRRPRGTR